MRTIAVTLVCLSVGACETPTPYEAATKPDAVGYSERQVEPGRCRVFEGGHSASAQHVEDYVLRRAAEIALRDGFDWLEIIGRGNETHTSLLPYSDGPRTIRSVEIACGKDPRPLGANTYDARSLLASLNASQDPWGLPAPR